MIRPARPFLRVIYALLLVIATGTIGYMAIEKWAFSDALYMTIITLSTVGYGEVEELSTAGRVFSIVLIIGGVGVMFYALTTIVQQLIEGSLAGILRRTRMEEKISKLKDHVILCGYGRVGREVARVLEGERTPFVVIDLDQEARAKAVKDGYLYLEGNATNDEVLKEAGIQHSRGLVAAVGSDADNIYITLSARGLRSDLFIVARASTEESEIKLRRAGADRTIVPHRLGGRHMAMITLRPLVVDFIDTAMHTHEQKLVLENMAVGADSPVAGMSIKEGQRHSGGAAILAVRKKDGTLLTSPSQETLVEPGDELVIIGTREQLRTLDGSL